MASVPTSTPTQLPAPLLGNEGVPAATTFNWGFEMPDGSRFTDDQWTPLRHAAAQRKRVRFVRARPFEAVVRHNRGDGKREERSAARVARVATFDPRKVRAWRQASRVDLDLERLRPRRDARLQHEARGRRDPVRSAAQRHVDVERQHFLDLGFVAARRVRKARLDLNTNHTAAARQQARQAGPECA